MLCFDDADEELWVEDPEEYIRNGYDIIEDIYSPKTAAVSVLYTLCSSKKKNQLDSIMAFILTESAEQTVTVSNMSYMRLRGGTLTQFMYLYWARQNLTVRAIDFKFFSCKCSFINPKFDH